MRNELIDKREISEEEIIPDSAKGEPLNNKAVQIDQEMNSVRKANFFTA